jgi:pyruvate/oxaloacetate carboxyltransferase
VVKKCRNADAESPEQHRIRELQTKNAQLKEDSQVWMTALRYSKISRDILEARMEVLKRELKEEKAKVEEVRKQWSGMAGVLGEKVNDKRA